MANQRSPPVGIDFQAGSGTTDASGDATISFARSFSKVPKVFLQGIDSGAKGIVLDVVSKTATGFVAKARKVTGVSQGSTGSVGSHRHSIGSPGTASFVTGGTKYTTYVASSTHTHTKYTMSGPSTTTAVVRQLAGYEILYAAKTSGGSPTTSFSALHGAGDIYVATLTHTHTFTTTGPSTTTLVMYDLTFATASAVTSIPSNTGYAGGHSHSNPSISAPVLAANFDWFAVLA